jgi:alkylated DNA repair protein alkB family protein 4
MNTTRPCGCKSHNTCYICEKDFGIAKEDTTRRRLQSFSRTYLFCPDQERLVMNASVENHALLPDGIIQFPGIKLIRDFVSKEEEETLLRDLDLIPWDASQSGRRKQNFGNEAYGVVVRYTL